MIDAESELVFRLAVAFQRGRVLQAANVSAGNGLVVDWRQVPSGEILLDDGDAFDVAHMFAAVVPTTLAWEALEGDGDETI